MTGWGLTSSTAVEAAQQPLPPASIEIILAAVAAVAFLALALATTARRAQSPLAFDVGLMCVAMAGYNIFEVAYAITRSPAWAWVEYAVASSSAVPTARMFVGYVGKRRRYRGALLLAAAYFLGLAAACLWPFVDPSWAMFPGGGAWALLMLAGFVPTFGGAGYLLYRHAIRSSREERARVRLLAGALLLGVGGVSTDLVAIASGPAPRLAPLGLVVSVALVAALMLRARIFEQVRVVTLVTAAVAAVIAVVAQLVVVSWLGSSLALVAVGTVFVVLALVAGVRPLYATLSDERARLEESATLGRFAQQMAHDIRNPLAAIHGAAQYLIEEHEQGRALEPHREFLDLILERAERLERVVADYQRLGRVEPEKSEADVNTLVREALAGLDVAHGGVTFEAELDASLPPCQLDPDLFLHALENVIRNAAEAMEGEGTVRVTTAPIGQGLVVRIADTGPGMDPRTAERAFDAFFTNKAGGTGLGLAFVFRVMEAHGGTARLDTAEEEGTTVELELPVSRPC